MDSKFITSLQGKEFILLAGLLNEFHINGGKSIETAELENSTLEIPKFKATVSGEKGTFTGHGDADKSNVNAMVAKHKYRMAETRAIARALRWYNNIGMCSADEMGGDNNKKEKKVIKNSNGDIEPVTGKEHAKTTLKEVFEESGGGTMDGGVEEPVYNKGDI